MKPILFQHKLSAKTSPLHGYGVFAETNIAAGTLIEECPTLLLSQAVHELNNYCFQAKEGLYALALGYGSLYNHSEQPNAHYIFDPEHNILELRALDTIALGEEILIAYGKDWFNKRKMQSKKITFGRKLWHFLNPAKSILARGIVVVAIIFFVMDVLVDIGLGKKIQERPRKTIPLN